MRSAKNLIVALGSMALFAGSIQADTNSGTYQPMEVSVQREPLDCVVPIFRAFLNIGSEKFTLLIPDDFHTGGDPAHGRFRMENTDGNCVINLTVLGASPSEGASLDAGAYREMLKQRYPGARIIGEFQGCASSGETGPGFDIEWKGAAGLLQKTRAVYLPTSVGVVEIVATSGANKFALTQTSLGGVLGSLRCSQGGKLIFHRVLDRS